MGKNLILIFLLQFVRLLEPKFLYFGQPVFYERDSVIIIWSINLSQEATQNAKQLFVFAL